MFVGSNERVGSHVLAQVQRSLLTKKECNRRAKENDNKRRMEKAKRKPAIQFPLCHVKAGQQHQHRPQQTEPSGVIDMACGNGSPFGLLHEGGTTEDDNDADIQGKQYIFDDFHCTLCSDIILFRGTIANPFANKPYKINIFLSEQTLMNTGQSPVVRGVVDNLI